MRESGGTAVAYQSHTSNLFKNLRNKLKEGVIRVFLVINDISQI